MKSPGYLDAVSSSTKVRRFAISIFARIGNRLRMLPVLATSASALVTLGFMGCTSGTQTPSIVLYVPATDGPSTALPPDFLLRPQTLSDALLYGVFVKEDEVCIRLAIGSAQYDLAIAGATVASGNEAEALRHVAAASKYRWQISSAAPITSPRGRLQVRVAYETGSSRHDLGVDIARLP